MQFEYGSQCPQKSCDTNCIFNEACSEIGKLVDLGHTGYCAQNQYFNKTECDCGTPLFKRSV